MVFHKIVDFKKQEDYLNFTTKDVQIEICCRDIYNNEYVWEVDLKTHRDISTDAKDITNKDNYKEIYDMEIRGQKLRLKNDINMNYDWKKAFERAPFIMQKLPNCIAKRTFKKKRPFEEIRCIGVLYIKYEKTSLKL